MRESGGEANLEAAVERDLGVGAIDHRVVGAIDQFVVGAIVPAIRGKPLSVYRGCVWAGVPRTGV